MGVWLSGVLPNGLGVAVPVVSITTSGSNLTLMSVPSAVVLGSPMMIKKKSAVNAEEGNG